MEFDRIRIKSNARLFYKNNTGTSICAILIYFGINMGISVVFYIFGMILGVTAAMSGGAGDTAYAVFMMIIYILSFAVGFGIMPLIMGLYNWYRQSIYEKTPLSEIFFLYRDGHFWDSVGTSLLKSLYTWLWSLLFIVPGIIKAYSYSQTLFIKSENPNLSASRAIELSKIMMEGHKMDMFMLHLSFFGWIILSVFTYNILGIVYVFPYFYAALAFAYEEIKADAAARGVIDISEISQTQDGGF